jgi:anti-sigma factor RsiW
MTCEQTHELINPYVDGELDLLRNVEIEHHLGDCETCRLERQDQSILRSLIQDSAPYFSASDLLKQRVTKQIRAVTPKPAVRRSSRASLAAAAAVILALAGVLLWTILSMRSRPGTDDLIAQEVVASHIRSLMLNHLVDVPSSDQHTVKPWFNGKLDFAPEVKDLAAQGFPLIGGRLDYVGNKTVAALIYQKRRHPINLFAWTSPAASDQPQQQFSRQGYNVVHWIKSDTSYWVVSDVNSTDLQEFVQLMTQ